MGFIAPALPWIAKGAGILGGALFGKKAQASAQQRSPEEQTALTGAQGAATNLTGVGTGLEKTGSALTTGGQATLAAPTSYYSNLLRGSRAAQTQAVAAPTAAVTDVYRGAERNLERSGVRGAARDVATADLGRERASKIAGLVTGVQPAAAAALTSIGQTETGQGLEATGRAAGAYGQAGSVYGNLLPQGANNRMYAREEGRQAGNTAGSFIFDLLSGFKGKGSKGVLPSRATTPGYTGWMPG